MKSFRSTSNSMICAISRPRVDESPTSFLRGDLYGPFFTIKNPALRGILTSPKEEIYFAVTFTSSTWKTSVAFGGIGPVPASP